MSKKYKYLYFLTSLKTCFFTVALASELSESVITTSFPFEIHLKKSITDYSVKI